MLIVPAVLAGIRRIAKSLKELAGLSFLQFISSTRPIAKLFDLQIILQGVRLVKPTLKHDNNVQIIMSINCIASSILINRQLLQFRPKRDK